MLKRSFKSLIARVAVFALALSLVVPFVVPAAFAQSSALAFSYAENGTDRVAAFEATDADGDAIEWTLGGDDKKDFTIAGGVLMFKKSPDYETPVDADEDNVYEVTVEASGGEQEVVVTVTDEDEAGSVSLSDLQPQVGESVTATVKDPDGGVTGTVWQWSKSADQMTWTDIMGTLSGTYAPADADVGMYLRAMATYDDSLGDDPDIAEGVSAYAVEARPVINSAPVFPDHDPDNLVNIELEVMDGAAKGTSIGSPVAATDADNDPLLYELRENANAATADEDHFVIDLTTGQISVKVAAAVDYEGALALANAYTYNFRVVATDPSGSEGYIDVSVEVTPVDEAPTFTEGESSISVAEDGQIDNADSTYTAEDEDDVSAIFEYSVEGDDAEWFDIIPDAGLLTFRGVSGDDDEFRPNFEAPDDKNTDNKYEVTVVATSSSPVGGELVESDVKGRLAVTVTVTNAQDDGEITLSQRQAYVGSALTAVLSDPDGGTTGTTWQWYWAVLDESTGEVVVADGTVIARATSSSYTPVAADEGETLTARATYYDSVTDSGPKETRDETMSYTVKVRPTSNSVPKFVDQDLGTVGVQNTATDRSVDENKANENVGDPVDAVDTDDDNPLIYTLGGPDAGSFELGDRTRGQIKTAEKLDYETKSSYIVTLIATDPHGSSASITVNISVNDKQDGAVITGDGSFSYAENGTDRVAAFEATDADGDAIEWTLGGDDKKDFTIAGGVLMFKKSPDYETPVDADEDNVYEVTVEASGGEQEVVVTVTDEDEAGSVSLSDLQPQVGESVTATVKDPDGGVTGTVWQWSKSADQMTWTDIMGTLSGTYAPADADVGMYLRAMATYDDSLGDDPDIAEGVSAYAVEARPVINSAPVFPDHDPDNLVNIELEVMDGAAKGTSIGSPVAATDADNDPLLYELRENANAATADEDHFVIDLTTGQISVKVAAAVDYEGALALANAYTYNFRVVATDPSGSEGYIDVSVEVTPVDEAPTFTEGESSISVAEDGQIDNADSTYTAEDEDDVSAIFEYSVEGDDAEWFDIIPDAGLLTFRGVSGDDDEFRPNFEAPDDKNTDNKYEVTVVATSSSPVGGELVESDVKGRLAVTVTVTNAQDDGEITLSQRQAYVGSALTAVLSDPDGGTTGTTWQWYWAVLDESTGEVVVADGTVIARATSSSYTPVAADEGETLTARATYYDSVTDSGPKETRDKTMSYTVKVRPTSNSVPKFVDQDLGTVGVQNTATDRSVDENKANENVGDPVDAVDTDDDNPLIYTLGGPDAGSFKLGDRTRGQIKTAEKLDYETKSSYIVTLIATDPHGSSASITVNISVNDKQDGAVIQVKPLIEEALGSVALSTDSPAVGEAIMATLTDPNGRIENAAWQWAGSADGETYADIEGATEDSYTPTAEDHGTWLRATVSYDDAEGTDKSAMATAPGGVNNAPAFAAETASRSVDENAAAMTSVGDPVVAMDANEEELAYALSGDDAASFAIWPSGQITVAEGATLDYETKTGYMVTLTATDAAGASDSIAVTIMVNDLGLSSAYDADDSGDISEDEAVKAVQDYFADEITRGEVLAVLQLYFAS